MSIAPTPKPPYYAAIFSSVYREGDDEAYASMGERMVTLAMARPGFLGFEGGPKTPEGFSVFVSYWRSDADIIAWREDIEHQEARRLGREKWYPSFKIRIAKVERDYGQG